MNTGTGATPIQKACFTAMTILALVFLYVGTFTRIDLNNLKRQAIDKGFAHHNPTNDVWQWKENVK